jgi:ATP-dependent helicase/nuclease subunit A
MQGFLAWISAGDTQIKRDMEHGKNEVRIMTVHGAKGLEANIVFLPDTCQVPRKQDVPRLLNLAVDPGESEPGTPFPVWAVNQGASEQLLKEAYKRYAGKQDEEYNRLLYVAMTRARDELYIGGFEKKNKPPENCWHSMILSALEPHSECILDENNAPVAWCFAHEASPAEHERQDMRQPAAKAATLPPWAGQNPLHERQKGAPLSPSRLAAAEFGALHTGEPGILSPFEGGNTKRFKRGNLIHTLLEFLPRLEQKERSDRAMTFLMRPGNDLDPNEAGEILGEVNTILENPEFAPFFGPHSCGEAPFAARLPGSEDSPTAGLVFGQIDRIAILEHEILALDYKTNRPPPERVEDVPEIYLRQMAAYAQALGDMFVSKSVRCALLWTDAPRLMLLPGPLLARFAPGQIHKRQ